MLRPACPSIHSQPPRQLRRHAREPLQRPYDGGRCALAFHLSVRLVVFQKPGTIYAEFESAWACSLSPQIDFSLAASGLNPVSNLNSAHFGLDSTPQIADSQSIGSCSQTQKEL